MYDDDVITIENDVKAFTKKVNSINIDDDVYQVKDEIEELEAMFDEINSKMEDCDNDLKDTSSNTKPLLNKLSQHRTDLEIARNKLNEKKSAWKSKYNMEMLQEGKLTGYERVKAERDLIMDQHKETDYQGDIIKGIGEQIKGANKNLEGINSELKQQGDQIINVHANTANINTKVASTEKVMTKMERRQRCAKVVGIIGIITVGLADITILVFKLINKYG